MALDGHQNSLPQSVSDLVAQDEEQYRIPRECRETNTRARHRARTATPATKDTALPSCVRLLLVFAPRESAPAEILATASGRGFLRQLVQCRAQHDPGPAVEDHFHADQQTDDPEGGDI